MTKTINDKQLGEIKLTYNPIKRELRIKHGKFIEIYNNMTPQEIEGIEQWTIQDIRWFKKYNPFYNLKIKL